MRGIVSILAVLAICSSVQAADSGQSVCRGKIVDANGAALAGAKVNVYVFLETDVPHFAPGAGGESVSGPDGGFSIATPAAGAGDFLITARKDGLAMGWAYAGYRKGAAEPNSVEIPLGPPREIAGVVVDESNAPIAGAIVHPLLSWPVDVRQRLIIGIGALDWLTARTGADGAFRISNLPASATAELAVEAPGKAWTMTAEPEGDSMSIAAGAKNVPLAMRPQGCIHGKLVQKDGSPIAGATLTASEAKTRSFLQLIQETTAVTDKDGKFILDRLSPGTYNLRMIDRPQATFIASKAGVQVAEGKTTSDVMVEARQGGLLTLAMNDPNGVPVKGVHVSFLTDQDDPTSIWVTTPRHTSDANGMVVVRLNPGRYHPTPWADGFMAPREVRCWIQVEEDKSASATFTLTPLTRLRGVIRDQAGKPVEGVTIVNCNAFAGMYSQNAATDANGRFDIPAGNITNSPISLVNQLVCRHVARGLAASVEFQDANQPLEITLKPGATLTGKVVDEDGKPIAKARIDLDEYAVLLKKPPAAVTDANGRYALNAIAEGNWPVLASAEGYGDDSTTVTIDDANAAAAQDLVLKTARLSISGVVRDADGNAVANARVGCSGPYQHRSAYGVKADKDGKFTLRGLVEGKVSVSAYVNGGHGTTDATAGDKDVVITLQKLSAPPQRPSPKPTPTKDDF